MRYGGNHLNKEIQKGFDQHPIIYPNQWKYLYVGSRDWIYDYHLYHDPEEQLIALLDGDIDTEEEHDISQRLLGEKMIRSLKGIRKKVITHMFVDDMTMAQTARELNISRQLCNYYHKTAIEQLKNRFS